MFENFGFDCYRLENFVIEFPWIKVRVKTPRSKIDHKIMYASTLFLLLVLVLYCTSVFQFFSTVSYRIGGHQFSLNDVEHGVLRANKIGVGAVRRQFAEDDPRLKVIAVVGCTVQLLPE